MNQILKDFLKCNLVIVKALVESTGAFCFEKKRRMSMNLVIAEKPSVAQSIAKVTGATTKHDGYLEGSGYLVSWCVSHLVELAESAFFASMQGVS